MSTTSIVKTDKIDDLSKRVVMPSVTLRLDAFVVLHAFEASTFLSRLRGLHAYLPIDNDQALIIRPCNAIHTFTMSGPIDAVFLAADGAVLDVKTLPVRRWCSVRAAVAVIETNADVCQSLNIKRGVYLSRDTGVWK